MTATAVLAQIEVAVLRRLCEVPERLTVTEWADKYRILPESSTAQGKFRSSMIPYARRWMDLLADFEVKKVVLCWASQLGKSTILENAIGYRICQMPSPMMLVRPKIEDCENWMKKRFVPMVRDTPALRSRVILTRSTNTEERSATLRMKSFGGGFLFAASATSAAELASWSTPFLAQDEVDRMEPLPAEGHPCDIASIRQSAADIYTEVRTSTPGLADHSVIWSDLEGGTYERYHVPCPHCGHKQHLIWGGANEPTGFKWPTGKPEQAQYLCESCRALIDYDRLPWMLDPANGAAWVPSNPEGKYPSSHLPGWYSRFAGSSWGVIATEFVAAHDKPMKLQVFTNTRKAECWSETVSKVDASDLEKRVEDLKEGIVPTGVGVLTMGVDVQKRYLTYWVWGWGAGLQSWPITSGIIEGETETEPGQKGSPWNELDPIIRGGFKHESGRVLPVARTFIDSGHATSQVYRFTKLRASWRVFACKGVGGEGPFVAKASVQGQDRVLLFPVRVDQGKNEFLRSQIREQTVGAGYVHIAGWMTPEEVGGLVSEVRRPRPGLRGKTWYEWVPKKGAPPNEPLDCRNYARAALESMGIRVIAGLAKVAEDLAKPLPEGSPESTPAGQKPQGKRGPRTNFATDF